MWQDLPIFPEQASTGAAQVDAHFFFLLAVAGAGSVLIASLLVFFAVRYRRQARVDRSGASDGNLSLELLWTAVPTVLYLIIFFWGASVFFQLNRAPDNAMEIQVVGKRWMWKLQHSNGQREINELHIPVGRPVKLTMTSEDTIHSFFVPAFRVKMDVVPGRYTSVWFHPTKPGRYHLFCAEYCGTKHSGMVGSVIVMEPDAFQAWLGREGSGASPAAAGEKLFRDLGCVTCHNPAAESRGPDLAGLFGSTVALESGESLVVDETYLRESITNPRAKTVEGYKAVMPTFHGLVSEEGLLQIIEYIKTLADPEPAATPEREAS